MLTYILIAIAAVVLVFVVFVAMRPAEFRVTRSAAIAAPAAAVFAQVNDLHKWDAWSPWARLDPAAKATFAGPPTGPGAAFAWAGNDKIGEGRMTITESRPDELVRFRLEFVRPFKATNTAEFTFRPESGRTVVTWSMSGTNNFMSKAVGLFINCDRMVGVQFEQGLSNMASVVETAARQS
jgi:hypothetical protein